MHDEDTFLHWLELKSNAPVVFDELAGLLVLAMWPQPEGGDDEMGRACAMLNFESELKRAVVDGLLTVRNPLTLGKHTAPRGRALELAVVTPADLRSFLSQRGGIGLRIECQPTNQTTPTAVAVQRAAAQEELVLAKLRDLGYDPAQLPPTKSGKASVPKTQARKALAPMTKAIFDKAWQRLRNADLIKEASRP